MFRSATKLRAAEAGALRSIAHAKATNPSFSCARSTRCLSTTRYTPLKTQSLFQRRQFSATSSMENTRTESDAFGEVQVPSDKYWGAQTERSLENFRINQPQDRMPPPIVQAFGILKGAAATVNMKYGLGKAS
jgi:fumarate hydratase class II